MSRPDIVERLLDAAALPNGLYAEAADTIEALRKERDALQEGIADFIPDNLSVINPSIPDHITIPISATMGELRALITLAEGSKP